MTEFERFLRDALAVLLEIDAEQVSMTTPFAELGLDSLLGLRFARAIEDRIGSEVEFEWVFDHPTLQSLAAFLEQRFADAVA